MGAPGGEPDRGYRDGPQHEPAKERLVEGQAHRDEVGDVGVTALEAVAARGGRRLTLLVGVRVVQHLGARDVVGIGGRLEGTVNIAKNRRLPWTTVEAGFITNAPMDTVAVSVLDRDYDRDRDASNGNQPPAYRTTDELQEMRDAFAAPLEEEVADEYEAAFDRAVRKRFSILRPGG